ncbi:FAD-binding oxidoreductase [Rhizobium sp. NZLR1b]|uniref:NAD(P)/FAD-dependent oxidoreductase n=1 Tax=unclassified Rhizobium TaxID=2613769 RepID=UPI001C82EC31|nr:MULTISPECIES: FAD-dependent oxidoreductase [unclassified Rhizobium]MBX5173368.1 FAD-binding oxidoreductase [Rhizobium sp. NZLR1b]MBX5192564.1 FAD-binding oxidoreductase [Rhizobium sp. NZLR3b]
MKNFDIIVVGAGILGLATAYQAQKAGAKVLVLDAGATAYEASSRATGYLSLRGETPAESPLAQEAEKLWDSLDDELGYPTEWTQKGRIWAALDERELDELKSLYGTFQKTDIPFEFLDGDAMRKLIPCLSPNCLGGIWTSRSGHANPQRTSQAFAWAFNDLGGEIREYTPVLELLAEGGKVKGVRTPQGELHCDKLALCAAAHNSLLLAPLGIHFPLAPVRLEALVTTPMPPLFEQAFIGNGLSIRQTKRGNLHMNGGPYEWVDLEIGKEPAKPNTQIVRNILRRAIETMPVLKGAQFLRSWAGIVDMAPDQMTTIHRFEGPAGLVTAACSGHGFGMAPAVGIAVSQLLMNRETAMPVGQLSLDRFKNVAPDWRVRRNWQAGRYNS